MSFFNTRLKSGLLGCAAMAALGCFMAPGSAISADAAAGAAAGPPVMRLLTGDQYRQIITETFGSDIVVNGRFSQQARAPAGLLAVNLGHASVSAAQIAQFDAMARSVAEQIMEPAHRGLMVHCKPASEKAADDACAKQFFETVGQILFRRPLTEGELQGQVAAAADAAKKVGNFYDGLGFSLATMLASPEFIFRQEYAVADAAHPGQYMLDDYGKASRLSFFLWNSQPDTELLRAAKAGELNTTKGLTAQVDRMINSRKFETSARAFFTDMLQFELFDSLEKDAAIFPKFTGYVARDAREQTLRTMVDILLTKKGDYRDIFTARTTFMTPTLSAIYGMAVPKTTTNMEPADWQPVEFPVGDPRAGILSQVSFTALHGQPGRSSPTIRGKALREALLCQKVPDPPANVNFAVVQDTANPVYKTARARLTAHSTTPACAGCHKIMDPMGLALEHFDGSGSYRMKENGVEIDTSGALNGVAFKDELELGKVLHDDPATPACFVNRAVSYALGRDTVSGEKHWVEGLKTAFAADKYRMPELFRRIATSSEFFRVSEPMTAPIKAAAAQ